LEDSDFVENVLKSAEEALEEKYELKARGYDFDWAVCRVAEVLELPPAQVTAFGKSPQTVKARSLLGASKARHEHHCNRKEAQDKPADGESFIKER
jgi:hypothetical protein